MVSSNNNPPDAIARFWDQYINFLINHDIKESIRRWYVRRVEHYIGENKHKKLAQHTVEDINGYLRQLGRTIDLHLSHCRRL